MAKTSAPSLAAMAALGVQRREGLRSSEPAPSARPQVKYMQLSLEIEDYLRVKGLLARKGIGVQAVLVEALNRVLADHGEVPVDNVGAKP